MSFTADRRLWLTADRDRVVEEGDADAAFLFATPGKTVSDEDAERYGLKPAKKAEAKQAAPAEDKQASAPANKAKAPAKRKKG